MRATLALVSSLVVMSACAQDIGQVLVGDGSQAWRVVEAWYIDAEGIHHDITAACHLDNGFVFHGDQTFSREDVAPCDAEESWLVPSSGGTWAVDEYGAMTMRTGEAVFFYDVHLSPQQIVFDANLAQVGATGVYREILEPAREW